MVAGQWKKKETLFRRHTKKAIVKDAYANSDELEIVLLSRGDGAEGKDLEAGIGTGAGAGTGASAGAGAGNAMGTTETQFTLACLSHQSLPVLLTPDPSSLPQLLPPPAPPPPPPPPPSSSDVQPPPLQEQQQQVPQKKPEDDLRLADGRVVRHGKIYEAWFLGMSAKDRNPLSRQLGIFGEKSLKVQARTYKMKLAQQKFRKKRRLANVNSTKPNDGRSWSPFKCKDCHEVFGSQDALNGHSAYCKGRSVNDNASASNGSGSPGASNWGGTLAFAERSSPRSECLTDSAQLLGDSGQSTDYGVDLDFGLDLNQLFQPPPPTSSPLARGGGGGGGGGCVLSAVPTFGPTLDCDILHGVDVNDILDEIMAASDTVA